MTRRAAVLVVAGLTLLGCRRVGAPLTGPLGDLLTAAKAGDAASVRRLTESDPGLARAGWDGARASPMGSAAERGHLEVVRILLEAGADPRERDLSTRTPLHQAKTAEVAALLLERGVSPEVRSNEGETPLMTRAHVPAVARALLDAGARPDRRDGGGLTALHWVVNTTGEAVAGAAVLCAYGADPGLRDDSGRSPADVARAMLAENVGNRSQNLAMVEWLAPGGGCDALRQRFLQGRPAAPEERDAAVQDVLCRHTNDAYACYALAYAHRDGKGTTLDPRRAAELFERSCTAGYGPACGQLAWHLRYGRGVAVDEVRAGTLYTRACDGGEAWSCWQLSRAYAEGRGVSRDAARAAALGQKACAGGEKRACGGAP